jgi:hypothetical protein
MGILVGMSIVQGGHGLPFMARNVYEYLRGASISCIVPALDEVPDTELRETLIKV